MIDANSAKCGRHPVGYGQAKKLWVDSLFCLGISYLEMQMRSRRSTCIARPGDHIIFAYHYLCWGQIKIDLKALLLVLLITHQLFQLWTKTLDVSVHSGISIRMSDINSIPKTAKLYPQAGNIAIIRCMNRIACAAVCPEMKSRME